MLYRQDRYASAVVLAVYSREELGRSEILLSIRNETESSGGATFQAVRDRCKDHITKLQQGQKAVTTLISPEQGRRLILLRKNPNSAEYLAYRAALREATQRKASRDPHAMMQRRLRALYIDLGDDGGWTCPSEVSAADAFEVLNEVAGDYALTLDNLSLGDPKLKAAIAAWPDCPDLPAPEIPD